ncbi:hypothetical protein SH1V18_40200 [Vallitalea longa]|uniref:RNA polymerase sigma factor n=2 Tax=Vallitalea longa TaxID=2936439 RepID=A0A9W5YCK2_9FIRM|nr:hypothetical protein SH1V18_40200 [Vallitalea longa]
MYRQAYHILKDPQLAEDAVQDAFLNIFRNFSTIKYKQVCPYSKSYFIQTVKNRSIDLYRVKTKRRIISYDELENSLIDGLADIERTIKIKEVKKCLKKLPINYQSILIMKYYYGHTYKEISSLLNISDSNVKKRIIRAKKKYKNILQEEQLL